MTNNDRARDEFADRIDSEYSARSSDAPIGRWDTLMRDDATPLEKRVMSQILDKQLEIELKRKTLHSPLSLEAGQTRSATPGYHLSDIPKGVLGDISKIIEEVRELEDAEAQGAKIMVLAELSDLFGAIRAYLGKHYPGMSMADLEKMADLTERAFLNGRRS